MESDLRSATPLIRPRGDVPVRESRTLRGRIHEAFGELASRVSLVMGSPWAFGLAVLTIAGWGLSGPVFGYSDSWQLVINTGTTIVTFLMVFLIQHTQNKDARAIQLKLNELLAAVEGASNRLINVEKMSDEELDRLQRQFQHLADRIRVHGPSKEPHSIEEENGSPGPSPAS
jgi:low affinity Fe/Cu permease